MAFAQTLLANGMYDLMEYMIAPIVIKKKKDKKFCDIDFIMDTLPLYYIKNLMKNEINTHGRRWIKLEKQYKEGVKARILTQNDLDYSNNINQHIPNYAPIQIDNNMFHLPLQHYLEGIALNRLDNKNIKNGVRIYYKNYADVNLRRGLIIKTDAKYGNNMRLLTIRRLNMDPTHDDRKWIWDREYLRNPNDPHYHYYKRLCNVEVISIDMVVSNTYETMDNGDLRFIENVIS